MKASHAVLSFTVISLSPLTLMPTKSIGIMGLSSEGRLASSKGSPTITLVATLIKSTPIVFDTKGKERDARRLHSITWKGTQHEFFHYRKTCNSQFFSMYTLAKANLQNKHTQCRYANSQCTNILYKWPEYIHAHFLYVYCWWNTKTESNIEQKIHPALQINLNTRWFWREWIAFAATRCENVNLLF